MYSILLPVLILLLYASFTSEIQVTNHPVKKEQDRDSSNNDKSYQYVVPPALLTMTPFNQRALTDVRKKFENDDFKNVYYLPQQPSLNSATLRLPDLRSNLLDVHKVVDANPLMAALLLSSFLGIQPKSPGFNHPQHLSTNPYIELLLSHFGRYGPLYNGKPGIYGYNAANNYHNNKPFGAYKIYEDRDT